ncbi:MAG: helix-turn-helix transcriptional regulator [Gordonia sp. (in: high G+C Gram-positive bacteria)]|uniref:AraC family transcriptional regulator n=1 Tax=Gordonia sp. (in: high G+C Gram-positive bacteria) TaxID=84139 RepID=UPI003BB67AA2
MEDAQIEAWHQRINVDDPLGANSTRYLLRLGQQGLDNHMATFQVSADPPERFAEFLYWRPLRELMAFSLLRSPCTTDRTSALVQQYHSDFVVVGTQQLPGSGAVTQGGRTVAYTHPRHLVVVRNDEPFTQTSHQIADLAGIWVPTELLGIAPGVRWTMGPLVDSSPLARATAAYVNSFANDLAARRADISGDQEVAFANLIRAVLSTHRPDSFRPTDSDLYMREMTRSMIDQNFRDPEFTADSLAQLLFVSRRHLYRYFAGTGVSPARMIVQRRLANAKVLLGRNRQLPLTAVAAASGFASTDTLSKRFRAEFGMAPSEFRKELT